MSFENRLKRGLEAKAGEMGGVMEEDVTTALKNVRDRGARRRRIQFAGAAVAAAAILATGALAGPSILKTMRGTEPDGRIGIGSDETPSPTPSPEPTATVGGIDPTPEGSTSATYVRHTVWFTSGDYLQSSVRFASEGTAEQEATEILTKLFARPNQDELSAGLRTAIPAGTELIGLTIADGAATVDLSSEFIDGKIGVVFNQRVAQIIWTLVPLAPEGVTFEVEGSELPIDSPSKPAAYKELLAPITVAWPYPGATLTDLDLITGTANVFEATVTYRVLDADGNSVLVNKGKPVDEWFTTATCGTGCRGTWEARIDIDIDEIQEGTLEVYEVSAENGEPINLVSIPVTLDPSADGN